jgi:hypothetical protein
MAQTARHRELRARIVQRILPQIMIRFLEKNEDYGEGNDEFGAKGEVIEIGRKYKKLKSAVWDGQPLVGEPLEEVIDDMMGHLLLLREQLLPGEAFPLQADEFSCVDWAGRYDVAMQGLTDG